MLIAVYHFPWTVLSGVLAAAACVVLFKPSRQIVCVPNVEFTCLKASKYIDGKCNKNLSN